MRARSTSCLSSVVALTLAACGETKPTATFAQDGRAPLAASALPSPPSQTPGPTSAGAGETGDLTTAGQGQGTSDATGADAVGRSDGTSNSSAGSGNSTGTAGTSVASGTAEDSGPPIATDASNRIVGILYSVWADHFATSRDANGQPFVMSTGAPYGPNPTFNWWGIPAFGTANYHFMINNDPSQPNNALIDYHADLLHAAGVDFIAIDLTNGQQDLIVKSAQAVAKRYSQRDPARTPRVVLFVQDAASVAALQPLFFGGSYASHIWFTYAGKPLMLIGQANSLTLAGGVLDQFTTRHTWGLQGSTTNGRSN